MKKYIAMLLFLIAILFFTFYNIYDIESINLIIDNIKNVDPKYFIILFGVIILYFVLQGIYMKITLKSLKEKVSLKKTIFYSIIEFFFSSITPSATGGQPVQLVFMTKDKIPMRKSYITLMLNTIYFKLIIFLLGIFALIYNSNYVFSNSIIYIVFFILGLILDFGMVIGGFLLLFKQNLIEKILNLIVKIGKKILFFRKKLEKISVKETLKRYKDEVEYIKEHQCIIFITFIITFIQRLLIFSIAYIVFKALGINNYSYLELLTIQICVQVTIEAYPLPGGSGISENMLRDIFIGLFGIALANAGMVITRLFTLYIPLTVSGIIILVKCILDKIVEKEN